MSEKHRPPLVPLDTTQTSIKLAVSEDVSELQHTTLFDFGENDFELMHVTVSIHGLTGIISEQVASKRKMGLSRPSKGKMGQPKSKRGSSSAASTLTPTDISSADDSFLNKIPTTAVVAFSRNVSNSQTKIYTHLPSLPLGVPSSSCGYVNRYMASWPEHTVPCLHPSEVQSPNQSSFTFQRMMMKEQMVARTSRERSVMSSYVHETIDLRINLCRGKEMIPLGIASLAISGDEEGESLINIPLFRVSSKGKKVVGTPPKGVFKKSKSKKSSKGTAFPSDPSKKFSLAENATLRVTVRVIPHEAIKEAEARDKARKIHSKLTTEMSWSDGDGFVAAAKQLAACSPRLTTKKELKSTVVSKDPKAPSFLQGLFCGNPWEGKNENEAPWEAKPQAAPICQYSSSGSGSDPSKSNASGSNDQERYPAMALIGSSVLSSVSDSESESESDGDDVHLNKRIVIRKH